MFKHFKYKVIPVDLKERVYLEGKHSFTLGTRRRHNPYLSNNLALATIWWTGWDTGNEESSTSSKPGEIKPKKVSENNANNTRSRDGAMTTKVMTEEITQAQREHAYVEGEIAFNEGVPRVSNPYPRSSPTLQQVWINGWDHSRRIKKQEIRH
jgi:hypothetical protein